MRKDFCIFVLSHGRPENVKTIHLLSKYKYDGKIYIILDNEDKTINEYKKNYGEDRILIFNKEKISKDFDEMDNFNNRKTVVYARNACFNFAKKLKIKYFIQFDDDYTEFRFKFQSNKDFRCSKVWYNDLELIFNEMINFFEVDKRILTFAIMQHGDYVAGRFSSLSNSIFFKRKAMNSFLCSTERPFKFFGKLNEDVNFYVNEGKKGNLIFSTNLIALKQMQTQKNESGMSDIYNDLGTYVKSFYTLMLNPSSVKIFKMGSKEKRLHHKINWKYTVPCILSEEYKKD